MFKTKPAAITMALTASLFAGTAQAIQINDASSSSWTQIIFAGTSMASTGSGLVLSTANYAGVWFGNGAYVGRNPGWSVGDSVSGNYLGFTASFSAGAVDWDTYLIDTSGYEAAFTFVPTGCNSNAQSCYGVAATAGYRIYYADNISQAQSLSFSLDATQPHTYEFLMKNGQVSYRVDGQTVFSGAAYKPLAANSGLLVIGDGSGSNPSGVGAMTVSAIGYDSAPVADAFQTVAEPATGMLALAGLTMTGFLGRRRREIHGEVL